MKLFGMKKKPTLTRDAVVGFAAVAGVSALVISKVVHKHKINELDEKLDAELQMVSDLLNEMVERYQLKELSIRACKED